MLFNSLEFPVFLVLVFVLYWFVFNENLRAQNFFLLVVSYFFYGWWDWRFLSLMFLSSFVDYLLGLQLGRTEKPSRRRLLFGTSLVFNLGLLGFFKYYNFFVESFVNLLLAIGMQPNIRTLQVILPAGISFYTFQSLSYTIDIYRQKIQPAKDPIDFMAFVSFFPHLVAGPIQQAVYFLPQFYVQRQFDYEKAVDGIRQILWGFFKKVVLADTCAIFVNAIFDSADRLSGSILLFGAVLFAFQIYGDFSGYSDIGIGTARLFGFSLRRNFAYPYFSRDIAEFWRRWHISLSTWFREYLYIPLGGSQGSKTKQLRNVFIVFLVSGFWHGANWTFIVWGALNALYFLPILLLEKNRVHLDIAAADGVLPSIKEFFQIVLTFLLTCLAWIFFRADSVSAALVYIGHMVQEPFANPIVALYSLPISATRITEIPIAIFAILFTLVMEWCQRHKQHALEAMLIRTPVMRWGFYLFITICVVEYFSGDKPFIYFQF
jgi:D-alanyl-lipoteichoic acid acyltransferase DltB (MBOAT superfamily)